MPRVTKLPIALLLLLASATACASSGEGAASLTPEEVDPDAPTFTLQIDNDSFHDARVDLFWNGQMVRLGRVRGSTSETFQVEPRANQFRLRIDFVQGGQRYDTDPIIVQADQVVRYRIAP